MRVDDRRGSSCLITAVYASPVPTVRKQLWINLNRLASGMGDPWLIGGDFNAFIHASEKMGGSSRRQGTCSLFSEWINNNSLYDLGFKGTKFTWSIGSVAERLDRTISNGLWLNKFQEASTWHLPKIHSNHCPLLVRFGNSSGAREGKRPFRFRVSWLLNDGFNKFVREEWHVNAEYAQNVNNFTDKVGKWNRDVFGNIFRRKQKILARLGGIQRALENHNSRNLISLETQLRKDLDEVMAQEEIYWYQKARKDWIMLGDRNTSYFHRKTIQHGDIIILID